jgi:hypothetical protein
VIPKEPKIIINTIFPSQYYPGSLVDKNGDNKVTTYFINFKKTLLAYVLVKAINRLAMILAQQQREVIRRFYVLIYYTKNEDQYLPSSMT